MAHMDVLLREDVDNLGQRGQVVRVRAGYGRNYLLPQGLAIEATPGNKRMIEEQRRILAKREERERAAAQTEAERINGLEIRFDRRVGEHGALYGSVTVLDIAEALKERGFAVERRKIGLRDPIKQIGDYEVTVKLHRDVTPAVKIKVRKEGAPDDMAAEEPAGEEAAAQETAAQETAAPEAAAAETAAGAESEAAPGEEATGEQASTGAASTADEGRPADQETE